jgi:hypothetical protein
MNGPALLAVSTACTRAVFMAWRTASAGQTVANVGLLEKEKRCEIYSRSIITVDLNRCDTVRRAICISLGNQRRFNE